MQSNYKRLGDYIQEVNIRNKDLNNYPLLGVSIQKVLMPSIANIIGTDMSTYKLIKKNQFAYGPVTSRNGDKISIALAEKQDHALLSQAYTVFEVVDENELHPEYLMMWFKRPEFDRYARFMSHGSAREIFSWTEMCDTLLPIPSLEKQLEIVREYNVIQNRIKLNNNLIAKLEETAQAIYKQWFVDFEFPDENGLPYKRSGGKMIESGLGEIPFGWQRNNLGTIKEFTLGGDWGKETNVGNFNEEVYCIRGADIPTASLGQVGNIPSRFILTKNLQSRNLEFFDIVIEISGGSPVQSTGRCLLVSREYLKYLGKPVVCSNFCRVIKAKNDFAIFLFTTIKHLYKADVLFNYENSSNGVKNLALEDLFKEELIVVPTKIIVEKFDAVFMRTNNFLTVIGEELESLKYLSDLILSKMTKVSQ